MITPTHSVKDIINIEASNLRSKTNSRQKLHRPFPQVDKNDWWKLFVIKAKSVMVTRNIYPPVFKVLDEQKPFIEQLYFHFIGDEKFKGDPNKGIFVHGPNGIGKSIIMQAYTEIYMYFGKTITYQKAIDLGLLIKNSDSLKYYSTMPLLIDDLGYETTEASDFKAVIKPIANLIFIRYDLGSWTFATGQVPMNSKPYLDKYGKAVVDRMNAMFNEFELKGESLRK